ncbi:valine--tRNA ligase [Candidatus Marinimicrobia bacterium]|nr:valine--tRNA ligase [Candidatus Neomarinimicrobiota bacterium]
MELLKSYNPNEVEEKWYDYWEKNKIFSPNESDDTFTVMIPPPNVTGILHLGHVLNNTIQDILIRKESMMGKNTLWLPGTDHASIATETKVTQMLKDKGIVKKEIGRDEFIKHAWEWTDKYGGIITKQLKRLGSSCDWDREAFTMSDGYYKSVIHGFVKLYHDGMIYKGERMINWDPKGLTALSDEEVIHKEQQGSLWYFKYPIIGEDDYLIVATTRPETMLGDTGVAVNPNDERYSKYIGKKIMLPIVNKEIPIFADNYVDKDFGTGCVKVTPAHDPNDFEMAQRNNLHILNIMNEDGTFNNHVAEEYQGLDRFVVRKMIVAKIEALELLDKIEDYTHQVGFSERTNVVVEPRLSKQWFLKMKDLAKPALKVVKDKEVEFYPQRWEKIYNHWLNNINDWCISRQLWWGHRIPVWYKGDEVYCGESAPEGEGWVQDDDVLDTWFSSWLWPFATLGWPDKSKDLKQFYPTQDLVTGPDIIFFWVARMIMAGIYFQREIPFSKVYFTSIIRDEQGKKMSKSLGNSPDPLDLFDEYGVDAVRVSILMIAPQGTDVLFSVDRLDQGRNFMNKLWNCSRFIMMNIDDSQTIKSFDSIDKKSLEPVDLWILSKLNRTIMEVNQYLKDYKLNEAIKSIYSFIWKDYCDWYIEFSKSRIYGDNESSKEIVISVAVFVLRNTLKLLHPYAPFITEEIWSYFKNKDEDILVNSSWPESNKELISKKNEDEMQFIMMIISSVRNMKSELSISPKKEVELICRGSDKKTKVIVDNKKYLESLIKVTKINAATKVDKPNQSATAVIQDVEIFLPLAGLIDINKEVSRLKTKIADLEGRMKSVRGKLDNANFIKRAPKEIVQHEQNKYDNYKSDYDKLVENHNSLSS